LGSLCEIVNGFTPYRKNSEFWDNGNIPWFTIDDVREQGRFITFTKQHITQNALGENSKRMIPPDSILLCCTASIGEYVYTKISLVTNQQFNGLVIKDMEILNPKYLYFFVQTLKDTLTGVAGGYNFWLCFSI